MMKLYKIIIITRDRLINTTKFMTMTVCLLSISACELLPSKNTNIPTYGDYYLWLKTLNNEELLEEIKQQNKDKDIKSPDANIYVMLLHSLPNSPIYSPYKAKVMLNELQLKYVESRYNPTNLALITLLRDLLNEQLLIAQENSNISVQYRNAQNTLALLNEELEEKDLQLHSNEKQLAELTQQVELLKEQINQLHRIEKNINEHGN